MFLLVPDSILAHKHKNTQAIIFQKKCQNLSDATNFEQTIKSKMLRESCFGRPLTAFLHVRAECQKPSNLRKMRDALSDATIFYKIMFLIFKIINFVCASRLRRYAELRKTCASRRCCSASRGICGQGSG